MEKFQRTKPHLNLALLGHQGHGKTTLTAALLRAQAARGLARVIPYDTLTQGGYPQGGRPRHALDINGKDWYPDVYLPLTRAAYVECETPRRHLSLADCPGAPAAIGQMLRAARADGAVLVVSAVEGVRAQTREHLLLARHIGVSSVVVFLNACDAIDDPALIDLCEQQTREALSSHGFDGGRAVVVRGAARPALEGDARWGAALDELLDAIDLAIPEPVRPQGGPLLLPVRGVLGPMVCRARGTIVCGIIEQGKTLGLRPGDRPDVEIVQPGGVMRTTITNVTIFCRNVDEGRAGDNVGCLIRGIERQSIRPGAVLVTRGSLSPRERFTCEVTLLRPEQGGRHTPFKRGYQPVFHFLTAAVPGVCELAPGEVAEPGATVKMTVRLTRPAALLEGARLALRDSLRTVALGTILALEG